MQKEESADYILFNFCWKQCKKKFTAGLMCFDFVKPFCTQYQLCHPVQQKRCLFCLISSLLKKLYRITNLLQHYWVAEFEAEEEGNETAQRNLLSWLRSNNHMCAWIVNLVVMVMRGGKDGVTKGVWPPVNEGQYSPHQQCLMFTVHYGCLKVFTLRNAEFGWPFGSIGYTKEL